MTSPCPRIRTLFGLSLSKPVCAGHVLRQAQDERGSCAQGFTLIEVMVALLVFGLAALALLRLEGATIRSTDAVGRALAAQLVARNVAIDAVTSAQAPTLGLATGSDVEGGRAWRWTRSVGPTGDARILKVDVSVADTTGQVAGRIEMIRPPGVAG